MQNKTSLPTHSAIGVSWRGLKSSNNNKISHKNLQHVFLLIQTRPRKKSDENRQNKLFLIEEKQAN